jgi:hypothetical protein
MQNIFRLRHVSAEHCQTGGSRPKPPGVHGLQNSCVMLEPMMKVPGWHLTAFGRTFMNTARARTCARTHALARLTLADWKEIRGGFRYW